MAGRAGGRGLESRSCNHCCNLIEMPNSVDYKNMLCHHKNFSKFKVSYGLILSVVSSGNPDVENRTFVSQYDFKDIEKERLLWEDNPRTRRKIRCATNSFGIYQHQKNK